MKKKVISLLICLALVFGGATALAEETDNLTTDAQYGSRAQAIEDLFDTYNPTGKQTFLDLQAEHQAFHEGRQEVRLGVIEYYASQLSTISAQVADGTLAPVEGRVQLQALRSEITALRDEIQVILEQKQNEAGDIKAEITALRDLIKSVLQQDEIVASEVAAYLEEFNDLFADHLAMDYKYADMVDSLLPAY